MAKKTIVTPEMDGVGYIDGGSVNDEILDMWHQLRRENGADDHKSIEAPFHELDRKHRQSILWTVSMIDDLGRLTDSEFAAKYSMHPVTAKKKRKEIGITKTNNIAWTDELCGLLGTMSDVEFCKKYGINRKSVKLKRIELGKMPFRRHERISWTLEMINNIGVISDREFSRKYNIDRSSVKRKRQELLMAGVAQATQ